MTLPLVHAGMFPYSLGTWLGLSQRAAAVVPLAALAMTATGLVLVGRSRLDAPRVAVTLWCTVAMIIVLGSLVRHTPEASHRLAWVMDTVWEPRQGQERKRPDPVKLAPSFSQRSATQDEHIHVGLHHARRMELSRALEEYVRGVAAGEAGRR
jgi:hypothetical protein